MEGLESGLKCFGEFTGRLIIEENSAKFEVQAVTAQKTGWFYDHRYNRQYLQGLVKGRRVLDVFSYVGAWGIEAAVAGAEHVTCIDSSQNAVDHVMQNAELNGVQGRVSAIKGKAVDQLKALIAEGEKFDAVVLDPPAFIKKRKDQKSGEAAYRHINELGIRLLNDEGLLVSASCSMTLSNEKLVDTVRGAARHLDRDAQLFHVGGQAADHPVHPAIPETDYIKAQFYRLYR